ncbi:MAG: hypothetical protein ACM3VS_18795 [Candidatus Dadabacteria bacterium]
MKTFLLFIYLPLIGLSSQAQRVTDLPEGKYETRLKNAERKWNAGDIHLMTDGRYRLSNSDESGEYKFSVAAQRVFFISGPLKGAHAYTTVSNNSPSIVLPVKENVFLKLEDEVWCSYVKM